MAVLLRLLLCLSLLANSAGGAWAAHASAPPTAKAAAAAAAAPCHSGSGVTAEAMPGHAVHAEAPVPSRGHGAGGEHCADHGCNCLQHCAYSLSVPGSIPTWVARAGAPLPQTLGGHGLPWPYRPIRPPIG